MLPSWRTVKRWEGNPEQWHREQSRRWSLGKKKKIFETCKYISGDSHKNLGLGWDFLHSHRVGVWIMGTCTLKQTEGWRTWRCFGSRCSSGYSEGLFCASTWKSDAREGYPGVPLSSGCSTLGTGGDDSWDESVPGHPVSVFSKEGTEAGSSTCRALEIQEIISGRRITEMRYVLW